MRSPLPLFLALAVWMQLSCSAAYHRSRVKDDDERLTVGKVQKEIRVGMSGASVAAALGSPNIVTTDEEGREVWIYDKLNSERVVSQSGSGVWLLFFAASGRAGAARTSQRTLTVIIKFDKGGKVRNFAYHATRF